MQCRWHKKVMLHLLELWSNKQASINLSPYVRKVYIFCRSVLPSVKQMLTGSIVWLSLKRGIGSIDSPVWCKYEPFAGHLFHQRAAAVTALSSPFSAAVAMCRTICLQQIHPQECCRESGKQHLFPSPQTDPIQYRVIKWGENQGTMPSISNWTHG